LTIGCAANDPAACNALGVAYEDGAGVPVDLGKAAAAYENACAKRYSLSCNNLGAMYRDGRGVVSDLSRASELFERACDLDGACSLLGALFERGKGRPVDVVQANALYRKGCDVGDLSSCRNLGWNLMEGAGGDKDPVAGVELLRRACDGSQQQAPYPDACARLGNAYADGDGVGRDDSKAVALFVRACELGLADACLGAGLAYRRGQGVPKNTRLSLELLGKACDGGVAEACRAVGGGKSTPAPCDVNKLPPGALGCPERFLALIARGSPLKGEPETTPVATGRMVTLTATAEGIEVTCDINVDAIGAVTAAALVQTTTAASVSTATKSTSLEVVAAFLSMIADPDAAKGAFVWLTTDGMERAASTMRDQSRTFGAVRVIVSAGADEAEVITTIRLVRAH